MKITSPFLLLILTLLPGISYGSDGEKPKFVKIKGVNWALYEAKISKQQKADLFKKLDLPDDAEDWHIIDFNGDGLPDVIYQEEDYFDFDVLWASFYLNDGDSLRRVLDISGHMSEIISHGKGRMMEFQMESAPCCDNHLYRKTYYRLSKDRSHCKDTPMFSDNTFCAVYVSSYVYGSDDSQDKGGNKSADSAITPGTLKKNTVKAMPLQPVNTAIHNKAGLEDSDDMTMNLLALFQVPVYIAAAIVLCIVAWVEIRKHKKLIK